jgi:glycosyltransferase involved in cell wall biosynthesis
MKFMILICTLPERASKLKSLTYSLDKQLVEGVDYKIHDGGRGLPTGTKRNYLIEQTQSEYFSFIDDDDHISNDYVAEIMKGIETNPDVITFNGWYTEHGHNKRNFTIRLGSAYYEDKNDHNFYYHRFPNHLAVFKRSLVQHIKFPPIWQLEDYKWAEQIHNRKLLKTEYHIPKMLYHYDCNPQQYARPARVRK